MVYHKILEKGGAISFFSNFKLFFRTNTLKIFAFFSNYSTNIGRDWDQYTEVSAKNSDIWQPFTRSDWNRRLCSYGNFSIHRNSHFLFFRTYVHVIICPMDIVHTSVYKKCFFDIFTSHMLFFHYRNCLVFAIYLNKFGSVFH